MIQLGAHLARHVITTSLFTIDLLKFSFFLKIFCEIRLSLQDWYSIWISGNYKVQLYDPRTGGFMPSSPGIGMHVEVKDPDDKIVLSRVIHHNILLNAKNVLNWSVFILTGIQFWRKVHIYITHAWWTHHMSLLQQHKVVLGNSVGMLHLHPSYE